MSKPAVQLIEPPIGADPLPVRPDGRREVIYADSDLVCSHSEVTCSYIADGSDVPAPIVRRGRRPVDAGARYMPTPQDIELETASIRARWTPAEVRQRRGTPDVHWTPPELTPVEC